MADRTPIHSGPDDPNRLLLHVVSRLARSMGRAAEDLAADEDLSLPELQMLLVLIQGGGFTGAQLARRTFVTPQAGHQVIRHLVDRGLVVQHPDPSDARTLTHELTAEGEVVARRCREAIEELDARVLAGVAAADRDRLVPALLQAAQTIKGGWFGDREAQTRAADRRARKKRPG